MFLFQTTTIIYWARLYNYTVSNVIFSLEQDPYSFIPQQRKRKPSMKRTHLKSCKDGKRINIISPHFRLRQTKLHSYRIVAGYNITETYSELEMQKSWQICQLLTITCLKIFNLQKNAFLQVKLGCQNILALDQPDIVVFSFNYKFEHE